MTVPIPPGVYDIVPRDPKEPWRSSYIWNRVETVLREVAESFCCREVRLPMFERTELFQRSVGESSDIVSKEMYTFEDRGGRSLSLRPEGTASVMRACIDKQLYLLPEAQRLFYLGPMFRYDRPQAGRYRQFYQFGVEMIGNPHPEQDAELIQMIWTMHERLGMKDVVIGLNSLGNEATRRHYREALQAHCRPHFSEMSEESQRRFHVNPLRILDSKDERDKEVLKGAPTIEKFLDEVSRRHFARVQELLTALEVPFSIAASLVRGLDYYNHIVFEVTSGKLGAQNAVAGGGRYDGLMKELGGPDLPAVGFAIGLERLILTLLKTEGVEMGPPKIRLHIIPLGEKAVQAAMCLAGRVREGNVSCFLDLSARKLKAAMQQASGMGSEYVLVLGEEELTTCRAELKEMSTGRTQSFPLDAIPRFFQKSAQESAFDHFTSCNKC